MQGQDNFQNNPNVSFALSLSLSHEHSSFPAAVWPVMSPQAECTSRESSYLQEICKRYNNVTLLSKFFLFQKI